MPQRYSSFAIKQTGIPATRLLSWSEFKKDRKGSIQNYILHLLSTTDTGLSCRDISEVSGIWVQSLTNPLKSLVDAGKLDIVGTAKSSVSSRMVLLYGLSVESKSKAL